MCWPFRCLDLDVSYPDTYLVNPGYSRKRKVDKCPGCETGAYELPGGDIPGSMGFSVQVAMYNIIELHHILMPKYNILPIYWALQCMVWFVKIFPQGVENRVGHAVADPCGSCGWCTYADPCASMRMWKSWCASTTYIHWILLCILMKIQICISLYKGKKRQQFLISFLPLFMP